MLLQWETIAESVQRLHLNLTPMCFPNWRLGVAYFLILKKWCIIYKEKKHNICDTVKRTIKKIIIKEVVAAKTFSMALEDIYDYIIKVTMALQIITGTSTMQSFWKKKNKPTTKKPQLGING